MAVRFNTQKQIDLAGEGVAGLVNLDIYTGTQPASANDAATGTLLGTITGIAWNVTANPAVLDAASYEVTAVAGGTAGWGRFRDAGGTLRMDGVVAGEFTMADPVVINGGTIRITAASLTQPSGE